MLELKKMLLDLGFKKSDDPFMAQDGAIQIVCFNAILEDSQIGNETYVKNRNSLFGMPVIVGFSDEQVVVQACQYGGKECQADPRIKEGGLIWFTEVFKPDEAREAEAFVKRALEKQCGPLYGKNLPPPAQ